MPQTEEHLDILHVLGVRRGIFVITKTDLVDPARVDVVREEIEILSLGTLLEGAPVIPVSTITGAGMLDGTGVAGLLVDQGRVRGVRLAPADGEGSIEVATDLLVDASGRGSRM